MVRGIRTGLWLMRSNTDRTRVAFFSHRSINFTGYSAINGQPPSLRPDLAVKNLYALSARMRPGCSRSAARPRPFPAHADSRMAQVQTWAA